MDAPGAGVTRSSEQRMLGKKNPGSLEDQLMFFITLFFPGEKESSK